MNDLDRNTRTLIVSFVIAIMVLIPLRFVEVGEQQARVFGMNSQVLGEVSEVVKPDSMQTVKLEEPYNEIDGNWGCIEKDKLNELEEAVSDRLQQAGVTEGDKVKLLDGLREQELNVCN
jgi:hypothetical protein